MQQYNLLFTSLSGEMLGGGQRSLLLLLERLDRTKFRPFLVCPTEGGLVEKAEKLGIETEIIRMGSLKTPNIFSTAATVFKLRRLIKKKKIELIHSDSPRQALYASLAVRKTKTPLIWHVRVSTAEKKSLDRFLYNRSRKVIAVSRAASLRFAEYDLASDKLVVIPNGVDLTQFKPMYPDRKLQEELGIEAGSVLVGTLGQLIPGKGQDVLLKAAKRIAEQAPEVTSVIVGNGNTVYRKTLEELSAGLGIEDKVRFIGNREDIPQIMSCLDITVLPSTSHLEGLSRVIIEAMACAKPVIATDTGGNPEAVEDGKTGILVPPGDPDGLALAILELARDADKRKRMGEAGRKRAEQLFSIEMNVDRIEKIYEEILCPSM